MKLGFIAFSLLSLLISMAPVAADPVFDLREELSKQGTSD
jgi:hypothetical protein